MSINELKPTPAILQSLVKVHFPDKHYSIVLARYHQFKKEQTPMTPAFLSTFLKAHWDTRLDCTGLVEEVRKKTAFVSDIVLRHLLVRFRLISLFLRNRNEGILLQMHWKILSFRAEEFRIWWISFNSSLHRLDMKMFVYLVYNAIIWMLCVSS